MTAEKVVLERMSDVLWQTTVYSTEGEVMQSGLMSATEASALGQAESLARHFKAELVVEDVGAGEAE